MPGEQPVPSRQQPVPSRQQPVPPRHQIVIVASADVVTGKDPQGRCEIPGVGPIPQSELERLACDAEFFGVLFSGDGEPLWHGPRRTHRHRRAAPRPPRARWRVRALRRRTGPLRIPPHRPVGQTRRRPHRHRQSRPPVRHLPPPPARPQTRPHPESERRLGHRPRPPPRPRPRRRPEHQTRPPPHTPNQPRTARTRPPAETPQGTRWVVPRRQRSSPSRLARSRVGSHQGCTFDPVPGHAAGCRRGRRIERSGEVARRAAGRRRPLRLGRGRSVGPARRGARQRTRVRP